MKKLIPFIFVLTSLACGKKEETKKIKTDEEISTVEVSGLQTKSLGESIIGSGVLSSKAEVKLAFKTGGLIKKIYVEDGQFVKAGQLLAELDMSEIEAQVNQAKIGLAKAKRDYDRVKNLYDDQAATQTNLQDANTGVELASQGVQAANFNQKLSRIYAPASGRILRKIAEQGELITPFAPAFILGTGNEAFKVKIGLADKDIVKVKVGNSASIELDAYPGESFSARISQIAQTVNPATGTYEVELDIAANGKKLISGFVAKASINPGLQKSSVVVPVAALVEANQGSAYVFCLKNNNIAVKKEIEIGKIIGNDVALIAGLSADEIVITKGAGFLSDGQKVIIANRK